MASKFDHFPFFRSFLFYCLCSHAFCPRTGWAAGATMAVNGQPPQAAAPGSMIPIACPGGNVTTIVLNFPMIVRLANRTNNAVAIYRYD